MFLGKQAEDKNAEMWEYWDGSVEGMIKNKRDKRNQFLKT